MSEVVFVALPKSESEFISGQEYIVPHLCEHCRWSAITIKMLTRIDRYNHNLWLVENMERMRKGLSEIDPPPRYSELNDENKLQDSKD